VLIPRVPSSSSPRKGLYNPKAFVTHAASLDQGCPHCPRFPTAASRRSLGRVSVPVWLIILSDQLWIAALVGHYPTNKLIQRGPLPRRQAFLPQETSGISRRFQRLSQTSGQVPTRYSPVRHCHTPKDRRVRLACVKRAASVRSEPGSNSQIEPPDTRLAPSAQEDPGTFYTGRKQILPSTTQALAYPNSKQRTYPRLPEDAQNDQNAACTSPLHNSNLSKEQARQRAEPPGFPDVGTAAMTWL
jgi:hypothetical protein